MDICFKHFLDKLTSVELPHQYVKALVKTACSPLVIVLMDDSFLLWEEIECLGLILSRASLIFLTMNFCSYAGILATADNLILLSSLFPPWEINMMTSQFNLLFAFWGMECQFI